jgi:hypothetical protein
MKTIKQWFNELPEPQRTQALKNTHKNTLRKKESNMSSALLSSFNWSGTEEGLDYWDNLCHLYATRE